MIAEERRNKIVSIVEENGSASIATLVREAGVSKMTLWRDVKQLEQEGLLRRVRGGVFSTRTKYAREVGFSDKLILNIDCKRAIGKLAAEMFLSEGALFTIEGGTTAAQVLQWTNLSEFTVLTNSLDVLGLLSASRPGRTAIASGGILRLPARTLVGPEAVKFFASHGADVCFVSCSGISIDRGITDINPLEIEVKKAMIASSRKAVVLADSSKFGKVSTQHLVDITDCHAIITDSRLSEQERGAFADSLNVPIYFAEVSP